VGLKSEPEGPRATRLAELESRRAALMAELEGRRASLPLRYWRQQAHLTSPAADLDLARKALEGGTAPMSRLLQRHGVTPTDLADALGVEGQMVEALLERPRAAPLVVLDGEDSQAPGPEAAEAGLSNTVSLLRRVDGPVDPAPSLRFYRPPGLEEPTALATIDALLRALADRSAGGPLPLDGIVLPKVRHPEEIELLDEVLGTAESDLGLPARSIKVAVLVESGWALAQLPEIARRAVARLCALIYGPVDHAADVGLPAIAPRHPVAELARATIVNVAGAAGVPAIDGMTLDYPVADPDLDAAANRRRFLERVALVHREAVDARTLGMLGKWVGHPAQLFAVLLAFEEALAPAVLASAAASLEAYRAAVDSARGATIIAGAMADRATDRHARVVLRQAVALGRFDPARALELEIIAPAELAEARALQASEAATGR
jgi:beta-methylmalyl-CoA/(S)-malyl-CoA lyase